MMKTSKPFAVFENTTLVYESNFIDEAAAFAIQDYTTRYLYDSVDDVIVTQGYINANKSDYLKGYWCDDYYDDEPVDDDDSDEPVEDDDSDEAEYRAMRDREISSYSF